MNSRIIITGGPGAGKTTLITALEKVVSTVSPNPGVLLSNNKWT